MNFLLLGAGRRVSFINELKKIGKVFCYEAEHDTPASKVCDVFVGLGWEDEKIEEDIKQIIININVNCIIPLQDKAVLFLSKFKKSLDINNITLLCPDIHCSDISLDKKKFEFFILNYFPNLYPKYEEGFSAFIKPRFGNGSRGLKVLQNIEEIKKIEKDSFIIQKYFDNIEEYSVDCFYHEGILVDCVPRIRIRVSNGEVLDSITFESRELEKYCLDIGKKLKYDGPACIQFFKDKKTNKIYVMEINARFGGGCILSLKSGFNMLQCILEKHENKEYSHIKNSWKKNFLMKRVNTEFYFEK